MNPSVCRFVLFVGKPGAEACPAVVTRVYPDGTTIDVTAFPPDGAQPVPFSAVPFGTGAEHDLFWSWPVIPKPPAPPIPGPSLGAPVVYTSSRGERWAALITKVYDRSTVDLTAFPPGAGIPPSQHQAVKMMRYAEDKSVWFWHVPA